MSRLWLEIAEMEYKVEPGPDGEEQVERILARFRHDHTRPRQWWNVWHSGGSLGRTFHRYLSWLEQNRLLLGRIGVRADSDQLEVVGIRFTTAGQAD